MAKQLTESACPSTGNVRCDLNERISHMYDYFFWILNFLKNFEIFFYWSNVRDLSTMDLTGTIATNIGLLGFLTVL